MYFFQLKKDYSMKPENDFIPSFEIPWHQGEKKIKQATHNPLITSQML